MTTRDKTITGQSDMRQLNPKIRRVYTHLVPKQLRSLVEDLLSRPYPKIYDDKAFIFIHIPKTAGKSISSILHGGGAYHLTYMEYKDIIGSKISDYYIFTVVREPVDRLISLYAYFLSGGNFSKEAFEFRDKWVRSCRDFDEFVRKSLPNKEVMNDRMFLPQSEFVINELGELANIEIIHFENLAIEFENVSRKLKIKQRLPHTNASQRKDLDIQLSDEARKIIKKIYERDYTLFGYPPP